jgi:hypothetical protein
VTRKKQKHGSITRGQRYFPQLEGLARKLNAISEPITDRGLTGIAARDAEDAQDRMAKRKEKLLRRARAAGHAV